MSELMCGQVVEAAPLGGWCQDPTSCSAESSGFPRKQLPPMAVPETTLNWLYSVLTSVDSSEFSVSLLANEQQNYIDVNRTYHDATEALSYYPSLSVRTDVYSM
jgi:hypothetical protein